MRAHLFVSALFAASLFGGAALADRPGDDGSARTSRIPVREMHVREVREPMQREARPHMTPDTRVRDPQVTERLRSRGDMIDRAPSRSSAAASKAAAANDATGAKAQREAAKAMRRMEEKKNAVIHCAPGDESCGPSARSARVAAEAGQKAERAENNRQRAEVQKMVDKIRAEKIREMLTKKICETHANMCSDNL